MKKNIMNSFLQNSREKTKKSLFAHNVHFRRKCNNIHFHFPFECFLISSNLINSNALLGGNNVIFFSFPRMFKNPFIAWLVVKEKVKDDKR
jgi:hypothetical protein